MSPKPSAFAAPGMERAIINTNGFFPLDIAYSRVPLDHCDIDVAAVPIAPHESISGRCYATEYGLDIAVFQDFDAVHACLPAPAACGWKCGAHPSCRLPEQLIFNRMESVRIFLQVFDAARFAEAQARTPPSDD